MLLGRLTERAALGQLLEAARGGRSGALVVHGEAGIGPAGYQPWLDNQRRLRVLITQLETLSQVIAGTDPRRDR